MKNDRVFVNGIWAEKKVFSNGGEIITLNFNIKRFVEFIEECNKAGYISEKGYIRFNIQGRKEPKFNQKGNEELNTYVDTWKPAPQPPNLHKYDATDRPPQGELPTDLPF